MRASAYLGDLGGLAGQPAADPAGSARHRRGRRSRPTRRRTAAIGRSPMSRRCASNWGLEQADLLAHSAAGDLALLYAAAHPQRIRTLTMITARGRAVGVDFTVEHRRDAADLRKSEPWYEGARDGFDRIWGWARRRTPTSTPVRPSSTVVGTRRPRRTRPWRSSRSTRRPRTRTHPPEPSTRPRPEPRSQHWTHRCCCSRARWTAGRGPKWPRRQRSSCPAPSWWSSRARPTTPGWTTLPSSPGPSWSSSAGAQLLSRPRLLYVRRVRRSRACSQPS